MREAQMFDPEETTSVVVNQFTKLLQLIERSIGDENFT